jgi:hypothetical protein
VELEDGDTEIVLDLALEITGELVSLSEAMLSLLFRVDKW